MTEPKDLSHVHFQPPDLDKFEWKFPLAQVTVSHQLMESTKRVQHSTCWFHECLDDDPREHAGEAICPRCRGILEGFGRWIEATQQG